MAKIKISKVSWVLFIFALVVVVILPLPMAAIIRQPTRQSLTEINSKYLALSWGDIWNGLRRKKGAGGSRGPDKEPICMIVPGKLTERNRDNFEQDGKIEIWNDHPLFLWQGSMAGIEVRHLRSDELMWSQPLKSEDRSIIYGGKPLQLGEVYYWRETLPLEQLPTRVSFRIMEAKKRDKVTSELETIESKLKTEGASGNKIALEKVNYFIKQGLWSDALREIYSQPNLFSELIEAIKRNDFCLVDSLSSLEDVLKVVKVVYAPPKSPNSGGL